MDKTELQTQQKYYLQQILLTVCGGQINLETYKFNHVFIVFGFSGSGKDTLIDSFLSTYTKHPFSKFVRTLTRSGRPGELPAADAFYVKPEFFDWLKNNKKFFYTYEKYDGDQFGYNIMHLIFELSRGHVIMVGGGEANLVGLASGIHNVFPDVPVTTFFINRPKEAIIAGLESRGGNPEEIKKRIAHIEKKWQPKPEQHFDYLIWNADLEQAKKDFSGAIEEILNNSAAS